MPALPGSESTLTWNLPNTHSTNMECFLKALSGTCDTCFAGYVSPLGAPFFCLHGTCAFKTCMVNMNTWIFLGGLSNSAEEYVH